MKRIFTTLVLMACITVSRAQQPPNIVMIVVDDAALSLFTDSLEFIHQKGFDSLLTRGAMVEMHCTNPLCNPARGSILTGMYAHNNGAYDNDTPLHPGLMFFPEALHNNGYATIAYVGKKNNTGPKKAEPYVDYQLTVQVTDYSDAPFFKKNGKKVTIIGHTTTIINDTALKWLSFLEPPFFFWIGEMAPHTPPKPAQNKDLYKNEVFPLTENFEHFTTDYPSFLYDTAGANFYTYADTTKLKKTTRQMYECMNDVSDLVWSVRETLRSRGLLENTIIMLLGDNGYMKGEHQLKGKNFPYRESVLVPCIIEYHPAISGGTIIKDVGAQIFDVGPTLLDLAGVSDAAFEAQSVGQSIFELVDDPRDIWYIRKIKIGSGEGEDEENNSPSFRGVQTKRFKFVRHQCDVQTEELFDLENDPQENVNLINNPYYVHVATKYRFKLDSMIIATKDTLSADTIKRECELISISGIKAQAITNGSEMKLAVSISPNPVDKVLRLQIASQIPEFQKISVSIVNNLGQLVEVKESPAASLLNLDIDVRKLPDGIYLLKTATGQDIDVRSFIVAH